MLRTLDCQALSVMLGQPIVMVLPEVVGVNLTNSLQKGVMATDLVLQVVQASHSTVKLLRITVAKYKGAGRFL